MLPLAAWPRKRTNWVVTVMASKTVNVAIAVVANSRSRELRKIIVRARFDFWRDSEDNQWFLASIDFGEPVEFSIKSGNPERLRTGCVIVGVFESRKLSAAAAALDRAAGGHLSALLRRGDMEGKAGTTLLLQQVPDITPQRVLLVGLGREREFGDRAFREAVGSAIGALNQTGAADAVLCLTA